MRLDKYLCDCGRATRKEAKEYIRAGRVTVNGISVKKGDTRVDENNDEIRLNGVKIQYCPVYVLAMYKLKGYVTAVSDRQQKTVMELIPEEFSKIGLLPVGRLDKETEGLLLFTNDGELQHRLISPKHEVKKIYYAEHEGKVSDPDIKAFSDGIILKDGTACLPATLEKIEDGKSRITVMEGKYHQVRRMMAARGLYVNYLRRESEASISLDGLQPGKCRMLTKEEIESLV